MSRPRWAAPLIALVLVGAVLLELGPVTGDDLFWHLAAGRWFLAHHTLPAQYPFLYDATRPWIHHEWLSQVILALCERVGGFWALRLFRALAVVGTLILVWRAARRRICAPLVEVVVLLAALVGMLPNAMVRPHMISWLCVAAVVLLADLPPPWPLRRWLVLVGILVVWANAHASIFLAAILLGAHAAALLVDARRLAAPDRARDGHAVALFLVAAVSWVAQPAGLALFRYTFFTTRVVDLSPEWWPLLRADVARDHTALFILWFVVAALTIAAAMLGWRSRRDRLGRFPSLIVALLELYLAARYRRFSAFLYIPLLYSLAELAPRLASMRAERPLQPVVRASIAFALVLTFFCVQLPDGRALVPRAPLQPGAYPELATEFLRRVHLQGHMLNPDGWGGYLEYSLYPDYLAYMDGELMLVEPDVRPDMFDVMLRRGNVEATLDKHGIDWYIEPTWYFTHTPPLDPSRWLLAWHDPVSVVLLRRTAALDENVRRVCAFYRQYPALVEHASFGFELRSRDGGPTPTSIPSVKASCDK